MSWTCSACTFQNQNAAGLACAICQTVRHAAAPEGDEGGSAKKKRKTAMTISSSSSSSSTTCSSSSSSSAADTWTCGACTLANAMARLQCAACQTMRPWDDAHETVRAVSFVDVQRDRSTIRLEGDRLQWICRGETLKSRLHALAWEVSNGGKKTVVRCPGDSRLVAELVDPGPGTGQATLKAELARLCCAAGFQLRTSGGGGSFSGPGSGTTAAAPRPSSVVDRRDAGTLLARAVVDTRARTRGIMPLLAECFRLECNTLHGKQDRERRRVFLCGGEVVHYSQKGSRDDGRGWACGFRNLQMVCSHIFAHGGQGADRLFGGLGAVPELFSLQEFLERAWQMGWDPAGSAHYQGSIVGTSNWIGTCEAGALLRSCGLRALQVAFHSAEQSQDAAAASQARPSHTSVKMGGLTVGKRKRTPPRPWWLTHHSSGGSGAIGAGKGKQMGADSKHSCGAAVMSWLRSYFAAGAPRSPTSTSAGSGSSSAFDRLDGYRAAARGDRDFGVFRCNVSPLYLQHQGHSRCVVGIEERHIVSGNGRGDPPKCYLVVLDPKDKGDELKSSLHAAGAWQKRVKRSVGTLYKASYDLLFVPCPSVGSPSQASASARSSFSSSASSSSSSSSGRRAAARMPPAPLSGAPDSGWRGTRYDGWPAPRGDLGMERVIAASPILTTDADRAASKLPEWGRFVWEKKKRQKR